MIWFDFIIDLWIYQLFTPDLSAEPILLLLFTPQPESGCAVKSNGIRPIGSSPLAKGRMHDRPYSLALTRQRVSGQGVKSNILLQNADWIQLLQTEYTCNACL